MNQEEILSEEEILDIEKNKETAAAAYTLLFAPILLITRRDSSFIAFHAKQGLVLGVLFLLLWWLGDFISLFRYSTVFILFAGVIGFLQAIGGHKYAIPVVSEIIENGFSPVKIAKSFGKIFAFLKTILGGSVPKKSENISEEKISEAVTKTLEKRVATLEKIVAELMMK